MVAEIDDGDLLLGKVRAQGADIVGPILGEAEGAGGEAQVAAVLGLGRALQHQHRGTASRAANAAHKAAFPARTTMMSEWVMACQGMSCFGIKGVHR